MVYLIPFRAIVRFLLIVHEILIRFFRYLIPTPHEMEHIHIDSQSLQL